MKVRSLCTVALATALVGVSVSGGAAYAAPDLPSTGTVEVSEGGDPGKGKTPDPEKPEEKLPDHVEIETNPDAGSLQIDQVSNLNFDNIKTSSSDVETFAKPIDLSKATPADVGTRGAIVGWSDVRAGAYGYTVTAKLTQQFTGAQGSTLDSSTISYSNGMAVADSKNKNVIPSNTKTGFELAFGGGAIDVVTADKTNKEGKGIYVMEFGQSKDYVPGSGAPAGAPGTDGNSVKLTVPSATASNMAEDTYTAKVTWSIVAAQ